MANTTFNMPRHLVFPPRNSQIHLQSQATRTASRQYCTQQKTRTVDDRQVGLSRRRKCDESADFRHTKSRVKMARLLHTAAYKSDAVDIYPLN
ncbi:hypothetical protein COO20_22360 [Thalassospira marina]|uniref:Uncharacterized protein n=1 Tax=Thalassospira marina TaxID=2048283 RepID=A0A2N3KG54_9PROT|nr:hypothetical protein COO20_22360 [Thalassospira marina]